MIKDPNLLSEAIILGIFLLLIIFLARAKTIKETKGYKKRDVEFMYTISKVS